jgi:putative ABC transport system permease protein
LRTEIKTDQIVYGQKVETGHTFAVTEPYAQQSGLQTGAGRWFNTSDFATQAAVAVIGPRIAAQLFGQVNPVGEFIRVNNVWLQVVGVLADRAKSKSEFEGIKLGLDDERIFVPWDSAKMRFPVRELEDEVSSLSLRLREGTSPEAAARVLQRLIEARHNGADDTTLIVPMGLYRQNQQTQKIFTIVMSSIAAVSLLVGGIGIMNIMLANVLERKKEIGLKRALGATQRDISAPVSGRSTGDFRNGCAARLARRYCGRLQYCSTGRLVGGMVATDADHRCFCLRCHRSGLRCIPARQAAQLDPIAALRSE